MLSPLVITAVAPDPIPVTGTDGKVHVAYELEVLNFSPRVATVTRLETLDGGPDGAVVATVEGEALAARTVVVMDAVPGANPAIPVGRTGLILVDDVYDSVADVPASVTHRLDATFAPVTPEYEGVSALYPGDPVSLTGGPVTTSTESPVVIGAPLAGAGWAVVQACCDLTSHRGGMLPIGGRINGSERFAVDWVKFDLNGDPTSIAAYLKSAFRGDSPSSEDYLAYGEPVLAVADGTIVTAVSDVPDTNTEAGALPTGIGLADLGGNTVTIDIGNGVYASYFHLVPGSPTVKVGDEVTRGQVIGRLGNSGNSTGTHLHFQMQRTPAAHTGDNVPFEIDTLTYVGSFDLNGFTPGPNAGARTNQLPLTGSVLDLPAVP